MNKMNEGIRFNSGFGIIELLITLLVIGFLSAYLVKTYKKDILEKGPLLQAVKEQFSLIESLNGAKVEKAGEDFFLVKNNSREIGFSSSGSFPFATIEMTDQDSQTTVVENVSSLRFTYYSSDGKLIIDEKAYDNPSLIGQIKVDLATHSGVEESNFYISDGERGVDLDGDKSNGCARLKTQRFLLRLK